MRGECKKEGVHKVSHRQSVGEKSYKAKYYSALRISNTVMLANNSVYSCLPPQKVFGNYSNLLDNLA